MQRLKMHIETDRLILREVTLDDVGHFYALDSDPLVHRYLGNHPVKQVEESEAMVRSIMEQYIRHGIGRWAMIEKRTSAFAGWCGLKYETRIRPFDYFDLGYRLMRKFWGNGYATEGAVATLKYGFTNLGLGKIHAAAHIDNDGSNAILRKLGFQWIEYFTFDDAVHNWYQLDKARYDHLLA